MMPEPGDDPLYRNPAMAQFYDAANKKHRHDFEYCMNLAKDAGSALDLGCGTGELAAAMAQTYSIKVTGVDRAAAMLDIARKRPGGAGVTWIKADARSVRLGARFDLIVLTGHAFQVFLTDDDQAAALATITAHLTPSGRFVFDSRNPAIQGWRGRTRENTTRRFVHPDLGEVDSWNVADYDPALDVLTYTNGYQVLSTGEEHAATAQIRFTPQAGLATRIAAAGLSVDTWLGDWHGEPVSPDHPDFIAIGRLA